MSIHEISRLAGVIVRALHHYDAIGLLPSTALTNQIKLLELRREQLGRLIALAWKTLGTGGTPMQFDAFDKNELRQYADGIQGKWAAPPPIRNTRGGNRTVRPVTLTI